MSKRYTLNMNQGPQINGKGGYPLDEADRFCVMAAQLREWLAPESMNRLIGGLQQVLTDEPCNFFICEDQLGFNIVNIILYSTKEPDIGIPIEVGNVRIVPGDLVFADRDGVLVIPKALEAEVITLALEKARGEKTVRRAIEEGMSSTEAFRRFGIL
jgi:hypothetical protein